jgi:D-tagatose-1,6-bisphosphate aldolase subunit GatZ/KbaZ
LSDRIRYYWPQDDARRALRDLEGRLRAAAPNPGLLSQYVGSGVVGEAMAAGADLRDMDALCRIAVRRMVRPWYDACR